MEKLEQYIEQTVLKPNTVLEDVERVCQEAIINNFPVVISPPFFVAQARAFLIKSNVRIGTVIGFPLGYNLPEVKILETELAIEEGADDIDMVVNIAAVKSKDWESVNKEVKSIVDICHQSEKIFKLIFETCLLDDEEIKKLCSICNELGVDYAKTSTGFSTAGADVETISKMRNWLIPAVKIKASGGIKDKNLLINLIQAGADRIGTSMGTKII
jgi:deoxyribose-phosphate aldolase